MTFLTLKAAILSVILALGCAGGPDEFELGYGHLFQGDSSLEGWQMDNEDSDIVTVGLVWKLKPTEVIVRDPVRQEVRISPVSPDPALTQDAEEVELPAPGEIADTLEVFDAFGTVTKIGFFLLAGLVLWTYRERLGRLIPGGNGKKKG